MAELEESAVFNWAWSDKLVTAMMSNEETKVQARISELSSTYFRTFRHGFLFWSPSTSVPVGTEY